MSKLLRQIAKRSIRSIDVMLVVAALCVAAAAAAQTSPPLQITYQLAMTNPASHLFEVQMRIEAPERLDHIDLQMPRWSPGRYAIYDFAMNVQEFAAYGACPPNANVTCTFPIYPVTRLDNQTWRVHINKQPSTLPAYYGVNYKVFANNLSGTFSQLDARHANFNGASLFMYVVGHKQDPVRLSIAAPAGWRIVNGRTEQSDQNLWEFPNYDVLIDTPTEIAPDWTMDEFKVDGKTYRVVVHSYGKEGGKRQQLVRDIERIVRAETAMWGAPDFDSYTFLIHFAPDNESGGDGMEHLTSTQIIQTGALADRGVYEDTLDTAAHEFFHVWNVKRLRPIELGPWDYTRPLATRSLWIAEGLTNYYGYLMQRRAGIWSDKQLLDAYSRTITEVENAPGSRLMSAEEASIIAAFIDRTVHAQNTNLGNTAIGYYPKGEVLGLVLDLLIRAGTRGQRSLDDVMRRMYEEFYLRSPNATYYLRGRGYTSEDFERITSQVVAEVSGNQLREFFAKYVRGTEVPPYEEALTGVGLRLVKTSTVGRTSSGTAVSGPANSLYRIEEVPSASAEARALRAAWLNGMRR